MVRAKVRRAACHDASVGTARIETRGPFPLLVLSTSPEVDEPLIGIVDASMRIVAADPRLGRLLTGVRHGVEGTSISDLVDERSRELLTLASRRVTHEVVLPSIAGSSSEILARAVIVGKATWLHLHERKVESRTQEPDENLVGRRSALAELERYLASNDATVLFVRGPLGIGKTAVLRAFEARCRELASPCFWIDARTQSPSDETILSAIVGAGLHGTPLATIVESIERLASRRWVVIVDNFDAWQEASSESAQLFARLPHACRVVVAARGTPHGPWWDAAARRPQPLVLGPLSTIEATELKARLGVPEEQRAAIQRRAAGHPLCIVTHATALRSQLAPTNTVPAAIDFADPTRRELVELAAIPARITEEILAAMMPDRSTVAEGYDFLTTLCVPDQAGVGLRMPGVLRDALRARLRERSPSRLATHQLTLASYYGKILEKGKPYAYPVLDDFLDTFEEHPVIRALVGACSDPPVRTRRVTAHDWYELESALHLSAPELSALVRRGQDPAVVSCLAEGDQGLVGILQYVIASNAMFNRVDRKRSADLDAVRDVLRAQGALTAEDGTIVCLSFVTADSSENAWGPAAKSFVRTLLHELVAVRPVATLALISKSLASVPTLRFPGGTRLTVAGEPAVYRDLRGVTPARLLRALLENDGATAPLVSGRVASTFDVSTDAVRDALGNVAQPGKLASSPLLMLGIVEREAGTTANPAERVQTLARLLRDTIASIDGGDREIKERAVLEATFLHRTGKHEKIASELGLAYSTFRRYLSRGIERVAERLRLQEQSLH